MEDFVEISVPAGKATIVWDGLTRTITQRFLTQEDVDKIKAASELIWMTGRALDITIRGIYGPERVQEKDQKSDT